MIRRCQMLLSLILVLPFLYFTTSVKAAENKPSGQVSIQSTSVAAGVGVQWGDGTLTFDGKHYPFSLQGLEALGVGYSEIKAEGTVYNLTKLSDFEGVYASAEVGATAGSGPSTVTMKNPNGVVIALHTVQEGVKLTLAAGGANIELKH